MKHYAKKYVRIIIKKFLHKHELTETFKVIGDAEALKVKERKLVKKKIKFFFPKF